jgi:hypothetical protein
MPRVVASTVFLCAWLGLAPQSGAEVRLSIHEGMVSLTATDATVAQILAEWGRAGRTTIINGERVSGGPVTVEFVDQSEDRVLDSLLRATAGYLAAPRPVDVPDASRYDRIVIIPTSTAPRTTNPAPQPTFQPPAFQPPAFVAPGQPPQIDIPDQVDPTGTPAPPSGLTQPRGPGFGFFQNPAAATQLPTGDAPRVTMPPQGMPGPAMPLGTSVPGMIIQPPQAQPPAAGAPAPVPQGR